MGKDNTQSLDEIMLLIDRIDGGSPKHYMQQSKIRAAIESYTQARIVEARIDELQEATKRGDLDLAYFSNRIDELSSRLRGNTK